MTLVEALEVLLAAMTPVGELRLSIPFGVYTLGMPWLPVLLLSLVGNMVPVLLLVPGLERTSRFLTSFPNPLGRLLQWRVERLRQTQAKRFAKYGPAFLVVLVALPLPFTGAWTGSLAAWVFQVPARTAIPLIAVGVLLAGVIVTLLTLAGAQAGIFLETR